MSDIMEQQRQHGEAQELAAKELMGGCIEAAVETADFSTTEVGNWHSWLREEVVKALRERDAEIERLRGLLRELINAQNWLFDSAWAEDLDRRVREALGE